MFLFRFLVLGPFSAYGLGWPDNRLAPWAASDVRRALKARVVWLSVLGFTEIKMPLQDWPAMAMCCL